MKKLLCLFLACISVTFFCSCNCEENAMVFLFMLNSCSKKRTIKIEEGSFILGFYNEISKDPEQTSVAKEYEGKLTITRISKQEYEDANGINVLEVDEFDGNVRYMTLSCYYIADGEKKYIVFEKLKVTHHPGSPYYFYIDKNGVLIKPGQRSVTITDNYSFYMGFNKEKELEGQTS